MSPFDFTRIGTQLLISEMKLFGDETSETKSKLTFAIFPTECYNLRSTYKPHLIWLKKIVKIEEKFGNKWRTTIVLPELEGMQYLLER